MTEERIQFLLERRLSGELSADEWAELAAGLRNDDNTSLIQDVMERALSSGAREEIFEEDRYMPLLQRMLRADRPDQVERPMRRLWVYRWMAAAAMLLVILGGWLWFRSSPGLQTVSKISGQNDVSPGGNKAVLTLADGRQVVLDSAVNGTLVRQGGADVEKMADGKIAYKILKGGNTEVVYNVLSTPRGGQYKLELPDGTKVWLNAASSIRYPTAFTGGTRVVVITGEAYFEVAKDLVRSFKVVLNAMDTIQVLGTQFDINCYTDEPSIRTTLLEGKVKVIHRDNTALLAPGEQANVDQAGGGQDGYGGQDGRDGQNSGRIHIRQQVNLQEVMAWKNGRFQFDKVELPVVLRELARWYDLDVQYEGKAPTDTFEGKIPRSAMLSQVLAVLEKNQIHFRVEGRKLVVKY